jgi:hypothetical protein
MNEKRIDPVENLWKYLEAPRAKVTLTRTDVDSLFRYKKNIEADIVTLKQQIESDKSMEDDAIERISKELYQIKKRLEIEKTEFKIIMDYVGNDVINPDGEYVVEFIKHMEKRIKDAEFKNNQLTDELSNVRREAVFAINKAQTERSQQIYDEAELSGYSRGVADTEEDLKKVQEENRHYENWIASLISEYNRTDALMFINKLTWKDRAIQAESRLEKIQEENKKWRTAISSIPTIPAIADYDSLKTFRDKMLEWDEKLGDM